MRHLLAGAFALAVFTGSAAAQVAQTPQAPPAAPGPVSGPLFYPARDPAPIVACGRLERVQVRNKDAGYLHYEPC